MSDTPESLFGMPCDLCEGLDGDFPVASRCRRCKRIVPGADGSTELRPMRYGVFRVAPPEER